MYDDNGYYSLRAILGYNCKYNIVLSERGIGKSYGTKLFLFNQPGRFMCLYRQQPDLEHAITDWIDPIIEQGLAKPEQFEWVGKSKTGIQLYYNGEPKAYFRCLTQVNHIKQEKFPDDLDWVWFDEFIPLAYKKLAGIPSEGDAIRTVVKTIEHDTVRSREEKGLRPLRVLMFANPFTWSNPILQYFKVRPVYGLHRVGPDIVCEMVEPRDTPKKGKKTVDDFLGNEVHKNNGWLDQTAFIVELPKNRRPFATLRLGKLFFKLTTGRSLVYIEPISGHPDKKSRKYGTLDGLREDEQCYETSMTSKHIDQFMVAGKLRFPDINTKFDFLNNLPR